MLDLQVLGSIGSSLERALGAVDSLAMTAVATAHVSNQSFPFVTIPQFGLHVAKIQPMTGAVATYFNPIVHFDERSEWEKYAAGSNNNLQSYVNASLQLQEHWAYFYGVRPQNYTLDPTDFIFMDDNVNNGTDPVPYNLPRPDHLDIYVPEWHRFPLILSYYPPANYGKGRVNLQLEFFSKYKSFSNFCCCCFDETDWYHTHLAKSMTRMIKNRKAIISEPFLIPRPDNPEEFAIEEPWCIYYQDFISAGENCMEPISQWMYPVIDSVDLIDVSAAIDFPSAYDVKAMIALDIYWRSLFKDILPQSSEGIIVVTENSCIPNAFTFQINGPVAKYMGVGDLHDPHFNQHVISSNLVDLNAYRMDESMYTGLPLDDQCVFTFHVYPSEEMLSSKFYNLQELIN